MKQFALRAVAVALLSLFAVALDQAHDSVEAVSPDIVISQVYGGGGNSGATYTHDFIELFNRGSSSVSLSGWSLQYASSSGTTWQVTNLSGTLSAGQYYLVQQAAGSGGTTALPTPNATGSIAMSATAGKVALNTSTTALTCGTPCTDSTIRDFIGYGTANAFEGAAAPALTNTTAALRAGSGCTDTDVNSADFATGTPSPRNTSTTLNVCVAGDAAPTVTATTPAENGAIAPAANIGITFSEPVSFDADSVALSCAPSGAHTVAVTGGPTTYTLNPSTDFTIGDTCTLTILAAEVTDTDESDPPNNMAANFILHFTVADVCAASFTPIYQIQGSGDTAAITTVVTTKGVVVGDYEGAQPALRGFYIQDPTGDANMATSDGIFVFTNSANQASLGDLVLVTGTAGEFEGQTQLSSVTSVIICSTGNTVPTTDVSFPVASSTFLERYEGMLVKLPQTLYVTEHFQLGRFGMIVMSANGRIEQPTNEVEPGQPAIDMQAANNLNRIIIDDELNSQNPDPILFARGGNPLSASNTLRGGDTATGIVGVMTFTWAGNSASGNAYRVRPINALGGSVPNFQPTNPRPASVPEVGGTLRVVGMNLLNLFNTFDGLPDTVDNCRFGVGGAPADCRGADSQVEFDRQWPKTVAGILALDPDVLGVNEIENDGYGADSTIKFLVDKLNLATSAGTYAYIDVDAETGQTNALGTDAIKVGMLYKPGVVTPVGQTAALNSEAFVNGGDDFPRSRPSLAQAFMENATGQVFIVDVNHFKSKGSACNADPSVEPPNHNGGQGNCNAVRVAAATALMEWLAGDPTGTGDPDILLVGDYNSYAMEDPLDVIEDAGFTNIVETIVGDDAYSYVFNGQWGSLDHAFASDSLLSQVEGVAEYHINSDEPSVLDFNTDFKTANLINTLYEDDQFRISDHDPVIVGLTLAGALPDTDEDGIPDFTDECDDQPEDLDGVGDTDGCPEFDFDNDGIADDIDIEPLTASNRFSDVGLGGQTTGEIVTPLPATFSVAVTDAAAPKGVRIVVSATNNLGQEVHVRIDGKATEIALKVGTYIVTDPTSTVTVEVVEGGPARLSVPVAGKLVEVIIEEGESALITETRDDQGRLLATTIKSLAGTITVGGSPLGPNGGEYELQVPASCAGMIFDKVILGTSGNDTLTGTGLRELILGFGGNDTLTGGAGNDCIVGGEGNDKLSGGSGNDKLLGDAGNDTIDGDSGTDSAVGGTETDTCNAESKTTCER